MVNLKGFRNILNTHVLSDNDIVVVTYEAPLPIMVFVHQVVAGSESHQPGIVGWGRDGN